MILILLLGPILIFFSWLTCVTTDYFWWLYLNSEFDLQVYNTDKQIACVQMPSPWKKNFQDRGTWRRRIRILFFQSCYLFKPKLITFFILFFYIIFFHFMPKFPLLCTIFFKLSNEFSKIRVTDQCNLKYFKTLT